MRWILATFLLFTGLYIILGQTTRHVALRRFLFVVFVTLSFVSIFLREYWTKLSKFLGVENGTALLTYLLTFGFISYVISSYKWRRNQEEKLVTIARKQALIEFEKDTNNDS